MTRDPVDFSRKGWKTLTALSVAVGAAIPVVAFILLFPLTVNMPTWDQWHEVPVWKAYFTGQSVWPLILAPYNGHFNVIPRAIFFLLGRLTSWNLRVEVVVGYLLSLATLGVLVAMLREWDRRLAVLAAPFAALFFSFTQYEDLATGYGLGQLLSNLTEVLAVFWLTRRDPARNRFGLAFFCAAVATFSWGAGVAAWPVGLLAVLSSPPPRRLRTGIWSLGGMAALFAAHAATSSGWVETVWRSVIPCFFVVTGGPYSFSAPQTVRVAMASGFALGFILLTLGAVFLRKPARRPFLRAWGLIALLGLANGGLITLARSYSPLDQDFPSHYVTAVFFAGLGVLALAARRALESVDEKRGAGRVPGVAALAAACALALAQSAVVSARWYPILKMWSVTVKINSEKLMRGTATDEDIKVSHCPDPQLVRENLDTLRRYRLAAFARGAPPRP